MTPLLHRFHRHGLKILGATLLVLLATGLWTWKNAPRPKNPQITTPVLALEGLSAKILYYNSAARPWLLAMRGDLLTPEDREDRSERVRDFAQAVQNPKLFHQLDRKYRFDTLLLVGDPSQYRPLLEQLLQARDWTLTYLDHTSLVFRRPADRPWEPKDLDAMRQRFPSSDDRAIFLAQAATKLLALGKNTEAKAYLDQAAALNSEVPEIWAGKAMYHLHRAEWPQALGAVDRALALDPQFLPALASKAQILYSTRRFSEAYEVSKQLMEFRPDDPNLLFYHAKIAHEAKAYGTEIAALEKLIELAEREKRPSAGYRVYLGQAYAADGQARPSVEQ
nr:hypothetical protein [Verrucomicrobiota bacterium]